MNQVGLQIYTVREFTGTPEGLRESFMNIRRAGYTSVQTAGGITDVESAKYYKECADNAEIRICGTHFDLNLMRNDLDSAMKIHDVIGTKNMGIGGMTSAARESEENLLAFIDEINEIAARIAKQGFKFTYHNHSFEFKKFGNKTLMDYLIDGFDKDNVTFVLDTYWVQHGGYDIRKMMDRLVGRIDILHLKDMAAFGENNAPYITEIGNGNINFEDIIPLGEKIGVKDFVVEQDTNFTTGNAFDSIITSYNYLKEHFMSE
ncbi:MAG: sugar phosphate isomerase/epimerase [Clostridia bacterium]|nr:sugar phosphate isomerase/epimerase [Clostridia bacterium]